MVGKTIFLIFVLTFLSGIKAESNPIVLMKTSKGEIILELEAKRAPVTVKNFLAYAKSKYYNNTVFHRVIKNFMIQGGGFTRKLSKKKTRKPIKNEANNGLTNRRGTIAMARTFIVDSATSQFFINVNDNNFLDHRDSSQRGYGYTVFGKVIKGMSVVDAIQNTKTGACGPFPKNCPLKQVVIHSIKIKKK